jgi:hypothetical protein
MLLIDGVKYELWTPKKEVEEFHPLVKEHYREIFGRNSIFIEGSKLESESGKGSVPDGFVVTLGEVSQWHIVEMELSTHQLYDHIVNQVGRFIGGVKNTVTQKKIIEAIYRHIQENKQRKAEFEETIGSGEIYKLLTDIISKSPVLTIIIEKRTLELDEAIDLLKYSPIEIVEFQTFVREGVGLPVHAHLFEPLYEPAISVKPKPTLQPSPESSFKINVYESYMKYDYIGVWAKWKHLFPSSDTEVKLEMDGRVIENKFCVASWGQGFVGGIKEWFKAHPELKPGDKLRITVLEPMKKYRLEIVK